MGTRDHATGAHVLCFIVGADEGLQQLVTAQAPVAVALEEVIELSLRVIHVQLLVAIFLILFFFLLIVVIVVEVFDVLLVWTIFRILSALLGGAFVVLRLVINNLLVLWSLLFLLRIIRAVVLLDIRPVLGVRELFGRDLCYGAIMTRLHLFLQLLELLLALICLLLFLSLFLLCFFEVDLQLITKVVRELKLIIWRFIVVLLHHFQVVKEEASLREFDVSAKGPGQAETNLFQIEIAKGTCDFLGVKTLPQVPGSILFFGVQERTQRSGFGPQRRFFLCFELCDVQLWAILTLSFRRPSVGALIVGQVRVSSLDDYFRSRYAEILALRRLLCLAHRCLAMSALFISLVLHQLAVLLLALVNIY